MLHIPQDKLYNQFGLGIQELKTATGSCFGHGSGLPGYIGCTRHQDDITISLMMNSSNMPLSVIDPRADDPTYDPMMELVETIFESVHKAYPRLPTPKVQLPVTHYTLGN